MSGDPTAPWQRIFDSVSNLCGHTGPVVEPIGCVDCAQITDDVLADLIRHGFVTIPAVAVSGVQPETRNDGEIECPKAVTVGPHTYTIEVSERRTKDGDGKYGWSDHHVTEIVLDPGQAPSQLRDTLLHETLHAVMNLIGVGKGDPPLLDYAAEERLVNALSPLLLDMLRRNPPLVDFLLSDQPLSRKKAA